MKRGHKYTMSAKRKEASKKLINWDLRMEIFRLKNQGWSFNQIGSALPVTPQRCQQIYSQIIFTQIMP